MSQNQKPKEKLTSTPHDSIIIDLPMVRTFSTGGGHGPEDTLTEGDEKIVTKKWQGYPPENLKVVGKPMPPMPEVAIPRYLGKAEYATRVVLPNMLHARVIRCIWAVSNMLNAIESVPPDFNNGGSSASDALFR